MPRKKRTFRGELIKLTMTVSLCGMLLLGVALICVFVYSFSGSARRDMEYYLSSIGKQLGDRVLHLEDAVNSVRHDTVLNDFFKENGYREERISAQLSYIADLFSEQNKVDDEEPFAVRMYLFNGKGQFARSYYYPYTEARMNELDGRYQELYRSFESLDSEFCYEVWEDVLNLCFTVYDENMESMGVCAVALNRDAVDLIFRDLEQYGECIWLVEGRDGSLLAANGNGGQGVRFLAENTAYEGQAVIGGRPHMYHIQECGFGLRTLTAVRSSAVYSAIRSSLILFLVIIAAMLAVIAVAVYFAAVRFTRPLGTIARNIGSFGRGERETRLEGFDLQEFDEISVVFNEMAERIHYLITQVYEKQLLATQAQVNYIQSQINPHFMFNILSMIGIKAKLTGNEEVYSLLSAFSSLLQGKIFRKGSVMIPLAEEMELVEFYLYLQSRRFQDRITYEIRYEKDALKRIRVPRLCVEPLVENAVCHGLEPKEGSGRICVSVEEKPEGLVITVEDDGVGFDAGSLPESEGEGHTHVSLANTRKLLQILYGDDCSMEIRSAPGEGTRVTLVLAFEPREGAERMQRDAGV